jgi:glycosyltransferase involved in cell wall biosynthesis
MGNPGGRLVVVSPLVLSGHYKSRIVHEVNCILITLHLRTWLPLGPQKFYFLTNTPFGYRPIREMMPATSRRKYHRIVFDLIDDFTAFDWAPHFSRQFQEQLLRVADAVVTGTQQLANAYAGSQFIPCGVEFAEFSDRKPEPTDIAELSKPVIGFFGTISERIDLALVEKIASNFENASVVLVGPVYFNAEDLPKRHNLHYLGLKPHAEIPAYAQAFDVGLIPFVLTPATVKLHPVKTLEYLAAGVPVVSTALPDVEQFYSGIVEVARSHDEFIDCVRRQLKNPDPARIQAGIEKARGASWQAMTDQMNAVLFADQPDAPQTPAAIDDPNTAPVPHT